LITSMIRELLFNYPYLTLLQAAFTIWMLVDAYRRPAESFWFWIILFLPGLGPLAYFVAVKAGDYRHLSLPAFLQSRTSLDELRYRAEQTPTLANHLELGTRLLEREEFEEAAQHLEAARKIEPGHGQVLYQLARCRLGMEQPAEAVPLLKALLGRDPRWSDYAAWYLLLEAQVAAGDPEGALGSCRELARLAPTLRHKCLLAEHLLDQGLTGEARSLLEKALRDHEFDPGPVRRRNWRWARQAKHLLKQAS
jgi:hypothetical protein